MITNRELVEGIGGTLEVAYRLNVHQTTVQRWVNGARIPKKYWRQLSALARGFASLDHIKAINSK